MEILNICQWFCDLDLSSIISGVVGAAISALVAFIILNKQVKEQRKELEYQRKLDEQRLAYQRTCEEVDKIINRGASFVAALDCVELTHRRNRFSRLMDDLESGKITEFDIKELHDSFKELVNRINLEGCAMDLLIKDDEKGEKLKEGLQGVSDKYQMYLDRFQLLLFWFDKKKICDITVDSYNKAANVDVKKLIYNYKQSTNDMNFVEPVTGNLYRPKKFEDAVFPDSDSHIMRMFFDIHIGYEGGEYELECFQTKAKQYIKSYCAERMKEVEILCQK